MIWIAPAVCPRYPVRPGYSPVTARLPPGRGNTPCCYTPIFIIEGSLKRERERERDGEKINFSSRPQNVHQLFPIDILPVHNQTFLLLLLLCYPHFFSLSISLSLLPPPPFLLLIWLWFIQLLFLFSFSFFFCFGAELFCFPIEISFAMSPVSRNGCLVEPMRRCRVGCYCFNFLHPRRIAIVRVSSFSFSFFWRTSTWESGQNWLCWFQPIESQEEEDEGEKNSGDECLQCPRSGESSRNYNKK